MTDSAKVVTVLGGYGIFGGRVAEALARDEICRVRIVGRSAKIGRNFAHRVGAEFYPSMLDDRDALRERQPELHGEDFGRSVRSAFGICDHPRL